VVKLIVNKPFPRSSLVVQNATKFLNDREYNRLWNFKFLDSSLKAEDLEPGLWVNENCEINNFHWQGGGGIYIGSNPKTPFDLRRSFQDISVTLDNCICEDVGLYALEIFNCEVLVKNCAFRGNYKLDPYIKDGNGQNNLVRINGARVTFENCLFYNSINPILVKSNSQVRLKDCHFSVCEMAVLADGMENPRRGDRYYNGGEGVAQVEMVGCTGFKIATLARAERKSSFLLDKCSTSGRLFVSDGGEVYNEEN
jgi:parallel beta helix pectate lyase-like protein